MTAPAAHQETPAPDWNTLPLEAGMQLIEAGAGSGKTYAVTVLYKRLLLELGLAPENILVVTFTRAATAELRVRIRDTLLAEYRLCREDASRQQDARRLEQAVYRFDEATICTIHGFCRRVLEEYAFESGAPLNVEWIDDDESILQELLEYFWRREPSWNSAGFTAYALQRQCTPEQLLPEVRQQCLRAGYARITGGEEAPADSSAEEQALCAAWEECQQIWRREEKHIRATLWDADVIQPRSQDKLRRMLDVLARHLAEDASAGLLSVWSLRASKADGKDLQGFGAYLQKICRADQTPPRHAFLPAWEDYMAQAQALEENYAQGLAHLQRRLLDYSRRQLSAYKRRRRLRSYDDALLELADALAGGPGSALSALLRKRWPAALIDEFQDTDHLQYRIFDALYREEGHAFVVGDPRQAIYSFRGADIFSYLRASREARQRHTLSVNRRAVPPLVAGLNALFRHTPRPFLWAEIGFEPAQPAREENAYLERDGSRSPPLEFWFLEDTHNKVSAARRRECIAAAVAQEIATLLAEAQEGRARIGDRPLESQDVAVLVRNHRQSEEVAAALLQVGVRSTLYRRSGVYLQEEARELELLLAAIANPEKEGLLRSALLTRCLGLSAQQLEQLEEHQRQEWGECIRRWHTAWRREGFLAMFRRLLQDQNIPARLLASRDGERFMTNLLHLGELLQQAATREHLEMNALLTWLGRKRAELSPTQEEEELRLESEDNLVRIVTIHNSKGLEYEVVFCPFLWTPPNLHYSPLAFSAYHDRDNHNDAAIHCGTPLPAQIKKAVQEELFAEELRLNYVALTRARCRCYVAWVADARSHERRDPLSWLVLPEQRATKIEQELSGVSPLAPLQALAAQVPDSIQLRQLPETTPETPRPLAEEPPADTLRPRILPGRVPQPRSVTSFTTLTKMAYPEQDAFFADSAVFPDEEPPAEQTPGEEERSIFSFPRGTEPGQCLHTILENVAFHDADSEAAEQEVRRALSQYGFPAHWVGVIHDMVRQVCATPLLKELPLRLCDLSPTDYLREMEFYCDIRQLSHPGLQQLLRQHQAPGARHPVTLPPFAPSHGYMRGFIDLVFGYRERFYLADYKSNWLGPQPADYAREGLPQVMAQHSYTLQYLLYTVAVHRLLGQRLPEYSYEKHFGGVLYLFLRGMDPTRGAACGVFYERPSGALIRALDNYLGDRGER